MLTIYLSVLLVVFVSLQLVQAQITDDQAAKAMAIYKLYGCSSDASDSRILQAIECQKASDIDFYNTGMESVMDACAEYVKDMSKDINIRFCKSLKGPNDPDSIMLIKCIIMEAGRAPDPSKATGKEECVATPPAAT